MKHIHAVEYVGNRAKQKCFHFLREQFCLSNNNKQKMQIRQKPEAKEIKERATLQARTPMSRGYPPPPPLGIFNSTRPTERTFCIYCNKIFIAPFLFQFIKNHFCLLSSKKVKKITTLLTGPTRSKMYTIHFVQAILWPLQM